nr:MAG TPA: Histone-lysine N-methyltransferase SETDB2 [Caudoviricetes sp.]
MTELAIRAKKFWFNKKVALEIVLSVLIAVLVSLKVW